MQAPHTPPGLRLVGRLRPTGQVRCVDCGYLTHVEVSAIWDRFQQTGAPGSAEESARELYPMDRDRLRFRRYRGVAALGCFRHMPLAETDDEEPLRRDELERRIYDGILLPRYCDVFQGYQPGLTPQEHLALQVLPAPVVPARAHQGPTWLQAGVISVITLLAGLVFGLAIGITVF